MKAIIRHLKHYVKYSILEPARGKFINNIDLKECEQYKGKKKVFALQTPTHGNLGDQAIAFAQKEFILKNLKDYEYIEVPFEEVFTKAKMIKRIISPDDLIIIHGGGNMGDMYLYEELTRRFIISYFKQTRIISFPQTISFSDTILGKIALMGSKRIYKRNNNVSIVARELKSYEIMEKEFGKDKVFLSPDIVLFLNERNELTRKGIVTCFRNDIEQNMDKSFKNTLLKVLEEKYQKITHTDTIVNYSVPLSQRNEELQNIWERFRRAEVVLTDRLHGMIFCVITGTPCIVFSNSNHKIEYSFKSWLNHLSYIKFINNTNVDKIINQIEDLKKINLDGQEKEGVKKVEFSSIVKLIGR